MELIDDDQFEGLGGQVGAVGAFDDVTGGVAVVAAIGGRDISILLQDYAQLTLVPLPGRGLTGGEHFGEERLIATITSDDATLFLIGWRGGNADHLARPDL